MPFEDRADAQFFFPTPDREETLAAMEYEMHFGHGLAVVTAGAGLGKTLLVRALAGRLQSTDHPVIVPWQAGGERSLIRECCKGFGVSVPSSGSAERAVGRIRRHLLRAASAGHNSVLIVDQAENLSFANLHELELLAGIEGAEGRLLPLILVGQSKVLSVLEGCGLETIKQQARRPRTLSPLSASETPAYIEHRLAIAGVAQPGTFDAEGVRLIHDAAEGIPRLINRFAHDALVAAYGSGAVCVDATLVREVTNEKAHGVTSPVRKASACGQGQAGAAAPMASVKSAAAREVGLRSVEQIAGGWEGSSPSAPAGVSGARTSSGRPGVIDASFDTDPKPAADVYGGDPTGPLAHLEADEFCDRLERAVARSERANAATEMTLSKMSAVEGHLHALLGRAESVIATLGGSIQEGASVADHVKRRAQEVSSESQRRVASLESRVAGVAAVVTDVEEQIRRVDGACASAEEIERRLSGQAARIADKADEVEQRVATISETLAGSEDARLAMERLMARAAAVSGTAEEKLGTVRESVSSAIDELTARASEAKQRLAIQAAHITETAEEKVAAIRGSVKSAIGELTRESGTVEQRLVSIRTKITATVEKMDGIERDVGERIVTRCRQTCERQMDAIHQEREAGLRDQLNHFRNEMDALYQTERERFEKVGQELQAQSDRTAQEAQERSLSITRELSSRIDRLKEDSTAVEQLHAKVSAKERTIRTAAKETEAVLSSLFDHVAALSERVSTVRVEVDRLSATASELSGPLAVSIERGQAVIKDAGAARGKLESIMERVGEALIQTGRACEHAHGARTTALECERILAQFDEKTEAGRAAAAQLSQLVSSGKETAEELSAASCEATNVATRLAGQHDGALRTTEQLQRGLEQGQQVIDRMTAATLTAERIVESAQLTSKDLHDRYDSAGRLVSELDSLNTTARQLHEALQSVVAHADEKVGRLGSHNAAASKVLKQLAEASVEIHAALEHALETRRKMEAQTEYVGSLTSQSQECVKELADKTQAAERISTKISTAADAVGPMVADLTTHVEKAVEVEQKLASQTARAGDIAGRLDSVTAALHQAKELNDSVTKNIDDAKAVGSELSATMEQILPQYQQLQESFAQTTGVIETSTQLKAEADAAVERFIESLQASRQVIDDVETQADRLGRQLQKARNDGERIEQQVTSIMAGPKKLLEQAQTQSAQLERVCEAVRKVFANLSRTSLEAKERAEQLRSAERGAAQRLERLISETTATTRTLNEWVSLAINAQTRLQQAVEGAPSIRQTHAGESLRRLSQPNEPIGRLADPHATPPPSGAATAAETAELVKAATQSKSKVAVTGTTQRPGQVPDGTTAVSGASERAAQIARMIEEAKKAEATV